MTLLKKGGGPNGSGVTHPPGPNQQQDERGLLPQVAANASNEQEPSPIRRKSLSARFIRLAFLRPNESFAFSISAMRMPEHMKVAFSPMLYNKRQSSTEAQP